MITHLSSLLVGVLFSGVQVPATPISLNFADTDVAQVLRIIGQQSGLNIVYTAPRAGITVQRDPGISSQPGATQSASGSDKIKITIHVRNVSAEQAVRDASAAAGLACRKTGNTYVVGAASDMATILKPYKVKAEVSVLGDPGAIATRIQKLYTDADVAAGSGNLSIEAIPEDIASIRASVATVSANPTATKLMIFKGGSIKDITAAVSKLVPSVQVAIVSDRANSPTAAEAGSRPFTESVAAFTGDGTELERAMKMATEMDDASIPTEDTVAIYDIRYGAAIPLRDMLKEAAPDVKVFVAPAHHEPVRATYQIISGASFSSGTGTSGSGSTSSSTGSGSSGSSTSSSGSGSSGSSGSSTTTGSQGSGDDQDDKSKRLVLRGKSQSVKQALKILADVDTRPFQIDVQVQVVDASPTATSDTGFDWSWSDLSFYEVPGGTAVANAATSTRPVGVGQFSRVPWSVAATLTGNITNKDARLLAKPNIRVLDNDSANVFIGDTIPIVTQSSNSNGQNTSVQNQAVGIQLLLRPRVNADGRITMRVHPVVSTVTGYVNNYPLTSSREAETTVMVKDGETMVIGGLIRDEDVKSMSEVPILSKLPFLGELFRSRTTNHRKSNVLVFITPRLVKDDEPAAGQAKP